MTSSLRDKSTSIAWNIHQSIQGTVPSFRSGIVARNISAKMRFISQVNSAESVPTDHYEVRYVSGWRGNYNELVGLIQSCVGARVNAEAVTDAIIDGLFLTPEPDMKWVTCWLRTGQE